MKILSTVAGALSLCLASAANAIQITDVKTFDRIFEIGDEFHFMFDLADYGFVKGRDTVVDASLTLEFRDPKAGPDRDPLEAPFISLFIDQGRQFMRVTDEDWIASAWFNENGHMIPYIKVDQDDVWLGDVTVNFEYLPGPDVEVPEPLPLVLISLGLLVIGLRRYKISR
ncbi:MAG: PEP-CTERM sorting domain-containing protein [Gammaproteobacteria bacterium]|nr:MAG: PEP-CTERM sorting domain-containing protein [Gammaproteobacteria bacterium]